jgi:hypothetical protein
MCDRPFVVLDFEYTPMEHVIMVTKLVHWNQVSIWGLCELSVPRVVLAHVFKFQRRWFGPYKTQYCLPNNTILLVAIHKFNPNLVLVNINKLKPNQFINDNTL